MPQVGKAQFEVWAIRHKPTGHFLPYSKRRAGFTHDDPGPGLPRLFNKPQFAKAALRFWLEGEWKESWSSGDYGEPEPAGAEPVARPDRKADEMEIIQLKLTETGLSYVGRS